MEAAQTLTLQPRTAVEVRDGNVWIEGMEIDDRTLVEIVTARLEQGVEAEVTVRDAVEIGARVLDRESVQAEVDFVRREFERANAELRAAFAERADKAAGDLEERLEKFLAEDGGAMANALDAHAEGLAELIAENFGVDRSTAVQHQLREQIAGQLRESRQDLLRQFSSEDGHNPLADFKASVVRQLDRAGEAERRVGEKLGKLETEIARLRDANEARVELEAERERSAVKGHDFEQRAFEVIQEMADSRGDVAHHVGNERSASGGKLGDVVVEVDAASMEAKARIVIETKDERLSRNEAWRVLDGAMDERGADFAILLVASDDKLPARVEPLREYEGNKMLVALDKGSYDLRALELAYRYARCRCLMAREQTLEVDAPGVQAAAEEALSALKDAQKIRLALTNISTTADGTRDTFDAMLARVRASLERVEGLIGAG